MLFTSSKWPIYLSLAGLMIVMLTLWYTNRLAGQLAEIERKQLRLLEPALERISRLDNLDSEDDFSMETEILEATETVPSILVDAASGSVVSWDQIESTDTVYIARMLDEWIDQGRQPIRIDAQLAYFGESYLLRQLRLFPIALLILISTFVLLAYISLSQARKSEQNRVWVGMAKETAHQLGTPISAIVGWVEHMKLMYEDQPDLIEISDELKKDVDRLSMVATRFSKIGAAPELTPINIYEELDKCRAYMQARAPRKVDFDFPDPGAGELKVAINPLLFDWVIENLLRNALDALDGKGTISAHVSQNGGKVYIDITDTGKGIEAKNIRKVFDPGFTTKQRGWGLGLSLVKRIIVEYHDGRIAVARSKPGVGTTFTIQLPQVL